MEGKHIFEIGGKKKNDKQIQNTGDAFIASDDIDREQAQLALAHF